MADWIMVELPDMPAGSGHGEALKQRITETVRAYQRDGVPEAVVYATGPDGWTPTLVDGGGAGLRAAGLKLHAADQVARAARDLAAAHWEYRQAAETVARRRAEGAS